MNSPIKTSTPNKTRFTAFFLGVIACSSLAVADEFADSYFTGQNPKLTAQERAAR